MPPRGRRAGGGRAGLAALAAATGTALFVAAPAVATIWPVRPTDRQHPIRSGFVDPRWVGPERGWTFHSAVDVSVREDVPTGAPRGLVRKVFALRAGDVLLTSVTPTHPCGRVRVGHVTYGHIGGLRVRVGDAVEPGDWIAWTCRTSWHVHITEFDQFNRKANPIRPGGLLTPREDTLAPVVKATRVANGRLRARIEDPQSFIGWFELFPRLYNDLAPYRIALDGRLVRSFDFVPLVPFDKVFAPETFRNLPAKDCLRRRRGSCAGQYWFRLGRVSAGRHVVEAWDGNMNHVSKEIVVPASRG